MATRIVNGTTYHVKGNRHTRPLISLADIADAAARAEFDYINGDDIYYPRLFNYRGAWYDLHEFERAGHDVLALGYDGVQAESYFSAVVVSYFDRGGCELDGEIIVGYLHW